MAVNVLAPLQEIFANSGALGNGLKIFVYQAGTTTKLNTYPTAADADAGTNANTNPVVLNSRGEPTSGGVWVPDTVSTYKLVLAPSSDTDPPTSPIRTQDNLITSVSWDSLLDRLPFLTNYSTIKANGSDQTTVINTFLDGLGAGATGVYIAPPSLIFDPGSVVSHIPVGVIIFDLSRLNSYTSVGQTTKRLGILASDTSTNDSHWSIESGHHPVIAQNNYGTAGTSSASSRLASWLWAVGRFDSAAAVAGGKDGWRPGAIVSFRKQTSANLWEWALRKQAPWLAISAEYEDWTAGVSATSGVTYVRGQSDIYVAASTGTTGATIPSHSSGTVSDGGVDWTWVSQGDTAIWAVDEYGRIRINGGNGTNDLIGARQALTDSTTQAIVRYTGRGASRAVSVRLEPTNSGSTVITPPFFYGDTDNTLNVRRGDNTTNLTTWTDSGGQLAREIRFNHAVATDADATPSVTGISTLYLSNTGATSITALDDGDDNQFVTLIATNANTTIVHAATLMLTGSANQALTTYSSITFQKVPNSISNRWIEVARSIK